ncbi:hypothetical protein TGRUB_200460 [Toxoplasma gondii RUB]|uniref:Uncharacterized protein n=13 Tax=Toxoplasma gondii TaxID=5811 RepID=B9Q3P8_TOXGV|nr:hypothetical protein TGGT1_200460 [Toxoplasma gondii GT1]ESS36453.1 hypothetical protein TGVEG_200460 [Toxoplasma gondii VEG]KAF4642517.1 hypothetical protein TGRH88_083280 [Toxoplasma gondii]KFG27945.1 hypothetical protein TGP89_200460 [Toxoplasma gondii p89]KFG29593.1 hypothetical protein TGDOM2_200460 [Toxoplasma gondii GAB2-2007-GAL-DOM2]KFG32687.1 hypothetical protein TGFOU_200460 [Toxoplasma gondii FOU]KFG56771.1 hypothetical protein TGRUB_200460 [Toxoplasma gondii RUB]KFG99404.1 hy
MSLSSDDDSVGGGARDPGFYDNQTVSQEGTVDSFIIRNIHSKRERARRGEDPDGADRGFFQVFVSSFKHCCAPATRKAVNEKTYQSQGRRKEPDCLKADPAGNLLYGGKRAATYTAGSSSSSSVSQDEAEGETVPKSGGRLTSVAVAWRINDTAGASRSVVLTSAQAAWAALVWCVRLENSERMSGRMLAEILLGAEQQRREVDLNLCLKNTPQFQSVELLRNIEGRVMEDLLGDFSGTLNEAVRDAGENGGDASSAAVYMIVSKIRVLGLYARKQGEFLDLSVFDPSPSEEDFFPPSFVGFKRLEDLLDFTIETFNRDPRVKRAPQAKITAYLFRSKLTYGHSLHQRDYGTKRPVGKDDWMKKEGLALRDPQFEAKVMYTNMYRATEQSPADENIFAMEPGTGMQIRDNREANARKNFKTRDEMDSEASFPRGRR